MGQGSHGVAAVVVQGVPDVLRSRWSPIGKLAGAGAALLSFAVLASPAAAAGTGQPGGYTLVDEPLGSTTVSVNPAGGNLLVRADDLTQDSSTYNVLLSRYYNSQANTTSGLGPKWSWSVGPDVFLVDSGAVLELHGPSGDVTELELQDDGTYSSDGFDGYIVAESNGGYTLHRDEGDTYSFDNSGTLTTYTNGDAFTVQNTSAAGHAFLGSFGTASGRRVNLSYNGTPRVIEVDDPASNHRYYGYDTQQRLSSYTDATGQTVYGYGAGGLLSSIAQPDGTAATIVYSGGKVASVNVSRPGQSTSGANYAYGPVSDSSCDTATDVSQTTVTPLGGGDPTVYCITADGYVDNTSADSAPEATGPAEDVDSSACDADVDGYPSVCADPYGADPDDDASADLDPFPAGSSAAARGFSTDAVPSSQQRRWRIHYTDWTTIRPNAQSYVVGNAYGHFTSSSADGWIFDRVHSTDNGYSLGTIYGAYRGCGYILSSTDRGNAPDGKPHSSCPTTLNYAVTRYSRKVNCKGIKIASGPKKGETSVCSTPSGGALLAAGAVECFNVRPLPDGHTTDCGTGATDRRLASPTAHTVSWRYITQDNHYVLIRDDSIPGNEAPWVFVRRSALPNDLCPYTRTLDDANTNHPIHKCFFTPS